MEKIQKSPPGHHTSQTTEPHSNLKTNAKRKRTLATIPQFLSGTVIQSPIHLQMTAFSLSFIHRQIRKKYKNHLSTIAFRPLSHIQTSKRTLNVKERWPSMLNSFQALTFKVQSTSKCQRSRCHSSLGTFGKNTKITSRPPYQPDH